MSLRHGVINVVVLQQDGKAVGRKVGLDVQASNIDVAE